MLFVMDGSETKDYGNNTMVECLLEIIIRAYEHDVKDSSTKINKVLQDIEKALCVDHTRGGYAINTTPKNIVTDEGWLMPYGILEFRWEIYYRYPYGSP